MTPKEFILWAEAYYGKYRPVVREEVFTWLTTKYKEPDTFIVGLKEEVCEEFSNQYKVPPDICILKHLNVQSIQYKGRKVLRITAEKKKHCIEETLNDQ